jgi:two-component system cell cycle response regulator CtrA
MRVLLVEDDPTTSRSIEMMLTHANLNVYATDLGEEGIDLAKLYDYDLILLDLNLPDMEGHEVLRQLRMARVDTPILILTGSDDTENKIKSFGFGADDYLTKPFHREELLRESMLSFGARRVMRSRSSRPAKLKSTLTRKRWMPLVALFI